MDSIQEIPQRTERKEKKPDKNKGYLLKLKYRKDEMMRKRSQLI